VSHRDDNGSEGTEMAARDWAQTAPAADDTDRLDAQLAQLMETVWACERAARNEERLDALVAAATRYTR
jgi:hypothetical protein